MHMINYWSMKLLLSYFLSSNPSGVEQKRRVQGGLKSCMAILT